MASAVEIGIDPFGQQTAGLQVRQVAGDVLDGDRQVELPLPVRQGRVALAGLHVDDVRDQRTRVAAEQRVRQRAVAPVEPGEVQSHQQPGQRVEQPLAEVGDLRDRGPTAAPGRAASSRCGG